MKLEYEPYVAVAEFSQFSCAHAACIYAVYSNGAAVRPVERSYYLQQSGLAGSARSDYAHHFAFAYFEVDAFEYLQLTETLFDTLDFYHCFFFIFIELRIYFLSIAKSGQYFLSCRLKDYCRFMPCLSCCLSTSLLTNMRFPVVPDVVVP